MGGITQNSFRNLANQQRRQRKGKLIELKSSDFTLERRSMHWPKLSLIEPHSSFGPQFGAKTGFHEESFVLCKPFCVLFPNFSPYRINRYTYPLFLKEGACMSPSFSFCLRRFCFVKGQIGSH